MQAHCHLPSESFCISRLQVFPHLTVQLLLFKSGDHLPQVLPRPRNHFLFLSTSETDLILSNSYKQNTANWWTLEILENCTGGDYWRSSSRRTPGPTCQGSPGRLLPSKPPQRSWRRGRGCTCGPQEPPSAPSLWGRSWQRGLCSPLRQVFLFHTVSNCLKNVKDKKTHQCT